MTLSVKTTTRFGRSPSKGTAIEPVSWLLTSMGRPAQTRVHSRSVSPSILPTADIVALVPEIPAPNSRKTKPNRLIHRGGGEVHP